MKLDNYLQLLTTAEHTRFRKMLISPFFGESSGLVSFYDSVMAQQGTAIQKIDTLASEIDKNAVWQKAFGKKPFSEQQYRLWCSDLTGKIQEFLVQLAFEKQVDEKELLLLRALQQRQSQQRQSQQGQSQQGRQSQQRQPNKLFTQVEAKVRSRNEEATLKDAAFYLRSFQLEQTVNLEREQNKQRSIDTRIVAASEALDVFYIAQKLKHACDAINLRNVLQLEINLQGVQAVKTLAEEPFFQQNQLIQTLYKAYLMLENTAESDYYEAFVASLNANMPLFDPKELRDLYTLALNYCIKKINTSDALFYDKIFVLYRELLENKAIFVENKLPAWDYKNIITVGLRLEKYDWVTHFLYHYNELLPDDFKQNALTYNLAKLQFAKKNYQKVIQLLQVVEYQDIFYSLDSRTTLIKTYCELDEYEALEAQLESFRIYLLRHKTISSFNKKQYENFIRWVRKIMQSPQNKKTRAALREKLQEVTVIADKQWLLKQVE
jgi:hypothetical protein